MARATARPTAPTAGCSATAGPTFGSRAAAGASSAARAPCSAAAPFHVEVEPDMAGQPLPARPVGPSWPPTSGAPFWPHLLGPSFGRRSLHLRRVPEAGRRARGGARQAHHLQLRPHRVAHRPASLERRARPPGQRSHRNGGALPRSQPESQRPRGGVLVTSARVLFFKLFEYEHDVRFFHPADPDLAAHIGRKSRRCASVPPRK